MLDTMLREGEPPHMGQSPESGSAEMRRADPQRRVAAARAAANVEKRGLGNILIGSFYSWLRPGGL
jgi:hypothetical protein